MNLYKIKDKYNILLMNKEKQKLIDLKLMRELVTYKRIVDILIYDRLGKKGEEAEELKLKLFEDIAPRLDEDYIERKLIEFKKETE